MTNSKRKSKHLKSLKILPRNLYPPYRFICNYIGSRNFALWQEDNLIPRALPLVPCELSNRASGGVACYFLLSSWRLWN